MKNFIHVRKASESLLVKHLKITQIYSNQTFGFPERELFVEVGHTLSSNVASTWTTAMIYDVKS